MEDRSLNLDVAASAIATASTEARRPFDDVTVVCMAVISYVVSSLLHEGLGHAGACLLVGGKPILLTSSSFRWDTTTGSEWAGRAIDAGGTLVNIAIALVCIALLRRSRPQSERRFFLWLFAAVNAFQGAGYLLASPLGGFGDWTYFTQEIPLRLPVRVGLTLVGAGLTWASLRFFGRELAPFLSASTPDGRKRQARRIVRVAYLAGGSTLLIEAAFQPPIFVLTSALAVFGGTGPMLALASFVTAAPSTSALSATASTRTRWILAALVVTAPFAAVFGPGIHFAQ